MRGPELWGTKGAERRGFEEISPDVMCTVCTLSPTLTHFLVTFSNVVFNDVFNFGGNLLVSSAGVIGPPVERCRPIRQTEGWLTRFQGHARYDIQ